MKAGTVLFCKNFHFKDGGEKDKLLIILNTPNNNEPYLVVPTTSQQHRKRTVLGCHSDRNYFYIDESQDSFIKNTWVVFNQVYTFTPSEMLKKGFKGMMYEQFDLESSLWKAIKNCILKSDDIEQNYLEMIQRG